MYDIDIYTYKEKPETNSGKYNIYPLNDKGNDKYYFKKESHVTTYIDYLNPIIYNHIVGGGKETLTNKENETNKENVDSNKNDKESENKNRVIQPTSKKMKRAASTQLIKSSKKKPMTNNYQNFDSTNVFFEKMINIERKNKNKERLSHNNSCDNIYDRSDKKFKVNKYFQQFHRKVNFEDVFGYPMPLNKTTRGNIYNNEISFLKDEMKTTQKLRPQTHLKQRESNFDIRNLPRTDSFIKNKNYSTFFNSFTKKLNESINVNHSNLLDNNEQEQVLNKNNDLRHKLIEQTNKQFLEKAKLPDIRKIANRNTVIRRVKTGITKFLGEKYNPYAFVIAKQNTKARNYTGGIFQY